MPDEHSLVVDTQRWENEGGAVGAIENSSKRQKERDTLLLDAEHRKFDVLRQGLDAPISDELAKEVARDIAPAMHKKWVSDRLAEGRTVWLRKHGFETPEALEHWLRLGGLSKPQSLRPDVQQEIVLQEDISPADRWKYFDLLAFQNFDDKGPGDYQLLPPTWIEKNESAALQNVQLVNKSLKEGTFSLDHLSQQVHENWVLANYMNRTGTWLEGYVDPAFYRQATQAYKDWETVAYGSNPSEPSKLEELRTNALEAIATFARSIQIPEGKNVPESTKKRLNETKDQLSSWAEMSVPEKVKDMAVVNETVDRMALLSVFTQTVEKD